MPKQPAHIVNHPTRMVHQCVGLLCQHCGAEWIQPLPFEAGRLGKHINWFLAQHGLCVAPSPKPIATEGQRA